MKYVNIAAFRRIVLKSKFKIAALDMGTKHIGVALADETKVSVTPRKDIARIPPRNSPESIAKLTQELQKFVIEHKVVGFVIGYPINMAGEITPLCEEIISVIEQVKCNCDGFANVTSIDNNVDNQVICTFWDERNSSIEAKSMTRQFFSHKKSVAIKQKDSFAASLILQSFINSS